MDFSSVHLYRRPPAERQAFLIPVGKPELATRKKTVYSYDLQQSAPLPQFVLEVAPSCCVGYLPMAR
jgi:hypothetical protein